MHLQDLRDRGAASLLHGPTEPARAGVSVVVPALDEASHVGRCLASVARQRGVEEVIVVDGGSRDATRRAVERALPGLEAAAIARRYGEVR